MKDCEAKVKLAADENKRSGPEYSEKLVLMLISDLHMNIIIMLVICVSINNVEGLSIWGAVWRYRNRPAHVASLRRCCGGFWVSVIIIEHMSQDVLGVLESLCHFSVVAF